jgi:hypothetical protein
MPKFYLKFNQAVIKEIPFPENKMFLSIGRHPDNDILIDNPAVSSHHAKITREENKFYIEDLNSTNGTFLNGLKIVKAEIHHKDNIQIVQHVLEFYNEEEISTPHINEADLGSTEKTLILTPEKQKELLQRFSTQEVAPTAVAEKKKVEKIGVLRVIEGGEIPTPYDVELTKLVTYLGTTPQCDIKIKGLFAPDVAAIINRRPEFYIMKAVKPGYPRVNKIPLRDEAHLNNGDVLEVGRTKCIFFIREKK